MLEKIKNKIKNYILLLKNVWRVKGFQQISIVEYREYLIQGMERRVLKSAFSIYQELNHGAKLQLSYRMLYRFFGPRLGVVAIDAKTGNVVGVAFYKFNERDLREGRVHSSFSGVLPRCRGVGLATEIRRSAIHHFKRNGVKGYSARISENNIASMKASVKLGFHPIETYVDFSTGERRKYMVCDFDDDYIEAP